MSVKNLRNSFLKSLGTKDKKDFQRRLSDDDAAFLLDDWYRYARDEQLAPTGDWKIWLFLGGRGAGKTRSGAQWMAEGVANEDMRRIGLIGATYDDTRAIRSKASPACSSSAPGRSSNRRTGE